MGNILSATREHRRLFEYNRLVPDLEGYAELWELEQRIIGDRARKLETEAPRFGSRTELVDALKAFLAEEEQNPPPSAVYLAERATLEEFRGVVAEFAVDGLTESQSFFPIVQRLPYRASMAVFRVLVDEFGCGNVEQAHSQLYRDMLRDLGLPTDLESYLDSTGEPTFAFANMFYWMSSRAPAPEYFLGGLAYLEASILYAFRPFADACSRLGLSGRYYTEHLHIDHFHSKELLIAIRELEAAQGLDTAKVWAGARLTSEILGAAVDAAVAKARAAA